jgi:hypothetical protein
MRNRRRESDRGRYTSASHQDLSAGQCPIEHGLTSGADLEPQQSLDVVDYLNNNFWASS